MAVYRDRYEAGWRNELADVRAADWYTPEMLELDRKIAAANVTIPLSDAETAYVEHLRKAESEFQIATGAEMGGSGKAPGEGKD